MTLERLVEEIRLRAERELADEQSKTAAEVDAIAKDADRRSAQVIEEGRKAAQAEGTREKAQKVAAAKLTSRKLVFETRERKTNEMLEDVRELLADYTSSPEYPAVLKRMYATAVDQLGKQLKVMGRAEDAAALKSAAGKSFDETPVKILGGLVAESADGARRLNLSFDELLRLREDQVRSLLAR